MQAAFLAALSGALVAGLLDHYFANQAFPHAVALFWLYAAVLVAASRIAGPALLAGDGVLIGDQDHVARADRVGRQLARR